MGKILRTVGAKVIDDCINCRGAFIREEARETAMLSATGRRTVEGWIPYAIRFVGRVRGRRSLCNRDCKSSVEAVAAVGSMREATRTWRNVIRSQEDHPEYCRIS